MTEVAPDPFLPSSLMKTWLQEAATTDELRARLDQYIEAHPTNWTI